MHSLRVRLKMSCAKFGVDWTGVSGFCYLSSGAGPGSSHVIGVRAPFTVWAVVPLSW